MSKEFLKFDGTEIEKHRWHSSKRPIATEGRY